MAFHILANQILCNNNCLLLLALCCLTVLASTVVVNSPFGNIKGEFVTKEDSGQSYVIFKNIPFAKPPVGELRFSKPEAHPKIDGVFDGTNKRTVKCPHPDGMLYGQEQGSEDCLILNIYAKGINPGNELKKVIVFIHGGGFTSGTSSFYDMSAFVISHDIIGVTINYRLGILGFLSTGNKASPGNYALWDQTMAIRWVKNNIKAFGGDPNDITISGESAGAISVAFLALSPVTRGLFSKACSQSGSATSASTNAIDAQRHSLEIGKRTGCWEGEITEKLNLHQSELLMTCLRNVNTSAFTSIMDLYSLSEIRNVPTIDGEFVPKNPSLLLQDESYLESIGFYDRSYFVSIVNNEFAMMKSIYDTIKEAILSNKEITEEEKQYFLHKQDNDIKKCYLQSRMNSEAISSSLIERVMSFYTRRHAGDDVALFDMVSDLIFLIPSYEFMNAASQQRKSKLWFLYFDYFPGFMKGKYKGTVHGLDLLYLFTPRLEDAEKILNVGIDGELDDGDFQLRSMYSSVIAEFMKTGEPGRALKEQLPNGWPEYDPENSYYLNFNLEPDVRSHLERSKRDWWLKTIPKWTKKTYAHTEL